MADPRNDLAAPGLSGVIANRFPTVNGTSNDPAQSPYAPGATPLPGAPLEPPGGDVPPPGTPPAPALDWHAYLINWGFTSDIVDELDRIFRTYADPSQASSSALAYIRGTDWYATTFPGIQEGMRLGVVSNEADYRSYTNQMNDLYQRYYGRSVTGADVSSALKSGYTTGHVNAHFSGQAYIAANQNDIQYTLGAFGPGEASDTELASLGDQQGGLDNVVGAQFQQRYAAALQRLHGVFQGTLASPNFSIQNGRTAAPSLAGGRNTGDIGA